MLAGLISSEASLLSGQMAVFSLCHYIAFPLRVSVSKLPLVIRTPVDWIMVHPKGLILT